MRDRIFMNVTHSQIEEYLLLGWIMRDTWMGTPREYYAVLMEWVCDCPAPHPKKGTPS